ncbi:MAG: choline-sulfatase [Chloroflexi bacterium]|nr:choline-sulfatase [Chloroflexota bacterium]
MISDRPNILLVMVDQLAACWTGPYGEQAASTPNLDRLAGQGITFEQMYCNAPICVASRASMMAGRYISAVRAYDNGSEFPASRPTFCHYLRLAGYRTILSGKMHFIGPDQLHGFEERLTTDIYPAGFDWTPDWRQEPVHNPGTSVRAVRASGVATRTMQIDYDEDVHAQAIRKLYRLARDYQDDNRRPWLLCVSYTHPHDPFVTTQEYWDRFEGVSLPAPTPPPPGDLPAYDRWLHIHHEIDRYPLSEQQIVAARRAYFGMVTFVDDLLGDLLCHLDRAGFSENTLVLFTSDHGEMLGERGMWYKRTMYDPSVRVPCIAAWPEHIPAACREPQATALLDLFPTLCELTGAQHPDGGAPPCDGTSLVPLLERRAGAGHDLAIAEYLGEGVCAPVRMLVQGNYKYVYVHGQPSQLYHLGSDPDERINLAGREDYAAVEQRMRQRVLTNWDPEAVHRDVLASQAERRAVLKALDTGVPAPWDFVTAGERGAHYVRRQNAQYTAAVERLPRVEEA